MRPTKMPGICYRQNTELQLLPFFFSTNHRLCSLRAMSCLGGGCKRSPQGRHGDDGSCRGGDRSEDGGDIDARAGEGVRLDRDGRGGRSAGAKPPCWLSAAAILGGHRMHNNMYPWCGVGTPFYVADQKFGRVAVVVSVDVAWCKGSIRVASKRCGSSPHLATRKWIG